MNDGAARLKGRFLFALLTLSALLCGRQALAVGRVDWKDRTIKESDSHAWTVEVSIFLSRAPDVATLPMRFSFQPVVYYERSLLDGHDGPQLRKVPLEGKAPLVESVDVGFLDPGNGQIQKRTKFSFKVTRGHGYEAGEYDVTIKDGRSDATVGSVAHIEFDGDNEVIDRRAIVFTGDKKAKKDDKPAADQSDDSAPKKKELTTDDPDYWKGGPKTDDTENQEKVEPRSGCGCHVGTSPAAPSVGSLVVMIGLLGARRIRRNRRQTDAAT